MTGRPLGASRSRSSSASMVLPAPSTPSMPTRTIPVAGSASTASATRSSTARRAGVTPASARGARGLDRPPPIERAPARVYEHHVAVAEQQHDEAVEDERVRQGRRAFRPPSHHDQVEEEGGQEQQR